jgi:hypothetical protein
MTTYQGPERRRFPRYRVRKDGTVLAGGEAILPSIDVLELSVGGARLYVPVKICLPERICLVYRGEEIVYPSRVAWIRGGFAGIAYEGEPFLRGENPIP